MKRHYFASARIGIILFILSAALLTLAACGPGQTFGPTFTPDPCSKEIVQAYLKSAEPLISEFSDEVTLGGSTPRSSLTSVISDLQSTRRKFASLDAPPCAAGVQNSMENSMNSSIEGFTAFLAEHPDYEVNRDFDAATASLKQAKDAMNDLKTKVGLP